MSHVLCRGVLFAALVLNAAAGRAHTLASTIVSVRMTDPDTVVITIAAEADPLIAKLEALAGAAAADPPATADHRRRRIESLFPTLLEHLDARVGGQAAETRTPGGCGRRHRAGRDAPDREGRPRATRVHLAEHVYLRRIPAGDDDREHGRGCRVASGTTNEQANQAGAIARRYQWDRGCRSLRSTGLRHPHRPQPRDGWSRRVRPATPPQRSS